MSPSAYITVRTSKSGKRYHVRYRPGGRYTKLIHAGAFKTRRDAETRRQFVIAELAAGRDPMTTLTALENVKPPRGFREDFQAFLSSRVDIAPGSVKVYTSTLRAMPDWLLDTPTGAIGWEDLSRAFASLKLEPRSKQKYRATVAQVFDYAAVVPNPARDRRFKLPKVAREEVNPPPAAHVLAMLDRISPRMRLPFVVIEQTGARVQEVSTLAWGDVDVIGNRLRVTRSSAKTGKARWLQAQPWLMGLVADLCPPEDRTAARRVFQFTPAGLRSAMSKACVAAQIPHYHPHDLRHRRISLWHGQGLPWREIADRVGQSSASITLDVYSHVMPLDEASPELLVDAIVRSP